VRADVVLGGVGAELYPGVFTRVPGRVVAAVGDAQVHGLVAAVLDRLVEDRPVLRHRVVAAARGKEQAHRQSQPPSVVSHAGDDR